MEVALVVLALVAACATLWALWTGGTRGSEPPPPAPAPAEPPPAEGSPAPRVAADPDRYWLPPGQTAEIGGYRISGGMIYLGSDLPKASGEGIEPALIDPNLRVLRRSSGAAAESIPHWPSYRELSPAGRGAYLDWLSRGRVDPRVDIGYVFLFFYGLERRLLADSEVSEAARAERPRLLEEVRRLMQFYGQNNSFRVHAANLLRLQELAETSGQAPGEEPPSGEGEQDTCDALRAGLARFAASSEPLPAAWALAWLRSDPAHELGIPASRCPAEFETLFALRYARQFPDGCRLEVDGPPLRVFYRPASRSFRSEIEFTLGALRDVWTLEGPRETLRDLAAGCANDLAAYSRHVGRFPAETRTLRGLALLPGELLDAGCWKAKDEFLGCLASLTGEDSAGILHLEEVARLLGAAAAPLSPAATAYYSSRLLAALGFGVEPDPAAHSLVIEAQSRLVVFRLPEPKPPAVSPRFLAASLVLHLDAIATGFGTRAAQQDRRNLAEHLEGAFLLSSYERRRLRAVVRWLELCEGRLSGLKDIVSGLHFDNRRVLARLFRTVAMADRSLSLAQLDHFRLISRLLGLSAGELAGDRIEAGPIEEDVARLDHHFRDLTPVKRILEEVIGSKPLPARPGRQFSGPKELTQEQFRALYRLLPQPVWERVHFDELVLDCREPAEDFIETVNELTIEKFGRPLFDGEDPIKLDPAVGKLLGGF